MKRYGRVTGRSYPVGLGGRERRGRARSKFRARGGTIILRDGDGTGMDVGPEIETNMAPLE